MKYGSLFSKSWINNFMGGGSIYVEMIQLASTTQRFTPYDYTNIGHDERFRCWSVIRLQKEAGKFHKFQHYYSVFFTVIIDFQLGINY
jgi:hypothetical protein